MDSFFEWLYCRALKQFPEKAEPLSRYNAFSDIAAAADSKSIMAIPHGRLRFMWDLQRQENFRASIPMNYLLLRSIRSRNLAQVWKI